MVDGKSQALNALTLASEVCASTLTTLGTRDALAPPPPELAILHKDLVSLMSFIYAQITKLAICLKPASPTYSACLSPLQELSKHVIALATCASLFDADAHGSTLVVEVCATAQEVIERTRGLLTALIATIVTPAADPDNEQEYLTRTGSVHELIEQARGPNGVSKSNIEAVRKKWAADSGILKDAFAEFEEMLEDSNGDEDDKPEDDLDDGWGELGLKNDAMTGEELSRAKSIQPVLRLVTLLHKRIPLDILVSVGRQPSKDYDIFVAQSSSLLSDFDEVVAAMYPTQQLSAISQTLRTMLQRISILRDTVQPFLPVPATDLSEKMSALSVDTSKNASRDVAKWFATCFAQIESLSGAVLASIPGGGD